MAAMMIASNNNNATTTTAAALDDTSSIDTERSTANTVEELVTDYLHYLQDRFESHLVGLSNSNSTTTPQQHQWATFWLHEEAHVEVHHEDALAMLNEKQIRIRSYLDNRKERILNFLWSLCRDAMDDDDNQAPPAHVFRAFCEREEQLMKLYLVGYIQSSSKQ
jgi:hypothetical protein